MGVVGQKDPPSKVNTFLAFYNGHVFIMLIVVSAFRELRKEISVVFLAWCVLAFHFCYVLNSVMTTSNIGSESYLSLYHIDYM